MSCLYMLTFPSGKKYIGITSKSIVERFREHVLNSETGREDRAVNRAIIKYGKDFVKQKILAFASDWQYLLMIERRAISVFGTFGHGGYNMTIGGEGTVGHKHTEETREKLRRSHTHTPRHTIPHSEKSRQLMSGIKKGRLLSEEHCKSISKALVGNKYALGTKQSKGSIEKRRIAMLSASKGVSFDAQTQKWRATVMVDGQSRSLGRYLDYSTAKQVRDDAVKAILAGRAQCQQQG